jgi:hypothetical protein
MADKPRETRGKIPLNRFLNDFRSNVPDHDLREKYSLSARSFVTLIKTLLARNIITQEDLAKRREVAVQRDLAKESQFLSGLFICPNCSHPHPERFEKCPACGVTVADFMPQVESRDPLTVTGNHFYVEDELDEREAPDDRAESKRSAPKPNEDKAPEEKPSSIGQIRAFFSKLKKRD